MTVFTIGTAQLIHADCMDILRSLSDGEYDLAIVDPPYGIGYSKRKFKTAKSSIQYIPKDWDDSIPEDDYFDELFRVSKNQIIWGGNYYDLPQSRCFVVWDKCQPEGLDQAMCEQAWCSFDRSAKMFKTSIQQISQDRIHPTQKPVKLYEWLLTTYAQPGQRILDTHLGSGSSAIAANNLGFTFTGIEIDGDYFQAAKARIEAAHRQEKLF